MKPRILRATVPVTVLLALALTGADWPRFRGPGGSGVSGESGLPVQWSDDSGVLWKTRLPGAGSSSPILTGNRVILTCYAGYGVGRGDPGDPEKLQRLIVCADLESGKILWKVAFPSKHREAPYRGIGMPNHGYASSTPVTDGKNVFAFLGTDGVVALDLDGKELWRAAVGPDPGTHGFGSGSSPILYKNLVIVPASVESESLVAFDKKTGREVWRAPATGYGGWWTTPVLVDAAEGRKELVVTVPDEIWGLNPENGKLRWYAESFGGSAVCSSAVASESVIYAAGGRQGLALAVRPGGRGDVTKSHVLWTADRGSYVPSPTLYRGHLYFVTDRGVAHCLDPRTGKDVYRERIEGAGNTYASVVAADDKLYVVTRRDGTFVLAAGPKFRQLAHNTLDSDDSDFNASPAVASGRILLRSDRFLYSIGGTASGKE